MLDQLSSGMIGGNCHLYPKEYNTAISRDAQLALAMQQLEKGKVDNMENKEQVVMRDGYFSTMMQHQEEDKAQKSMEKEQRAMTSTPTGKALLLIHSVLFLHHFLQSYIPQNLGVASKVTTLAMDSIFFFVNCLLHLLAVFRVAKTMPLWT